MKRVIHAFLLLVFLLSYSCANPNKRTLIERTRPDGQKVTCAEPPADISNPQIFTGIDAKLPKILEALQANISIQQKYERIRTEVKGIQAIEVLDYRLCLQYANGLIDSVTYNELFLKQIFPLLMKENTSEGSDASDKLKRADTQQIKVENSPGAKVQSVVQSPNSVNIQADSVIINQPLAQMDRKLSEAQKTQIILSLKQRQSSTIQVLALAPDHETQCFANVFRTMLLEAGWRSDRVAVVFWDPPLSGLEIRVSADPKAEETGKFLCQVLEDAGLTVQCVRDRRLEPETVELRIGSK